LRSIRERIQIDDRPIGEELFTRYFFEVWDLLSSQESHDPEEKKPRFLQLLTLVAFHTFIKEKTEATIFETHHGGEYDSTNVVQKPVVTGITTIGIDHLAQLGPSIENIAWHKAGIIKSGALAFSAPQEPGPAAVLQARASKQGVELKFVDLDPSLPVDAPALQAPVQRLNCSVAIAISRAFLDKKAPLEDRDLTSYDISKGIEKFSWPGRFEVIVEGSNEWFIDGAHNELSVKQAAEWFAKNTSERRRYVEMRIFFSFKSNRLALVCVHKSSSLATSLKNGTVQLSYAVWQNL